MKNWHKDFPNPLRMSYNSLIHKNIMTDEKILELATYYFYKQEDGWSGTDSGIIEFATVIKDRILDEIALKVWELK